MGRVMERILITGATGRIGANLVKALIEAGHTVRGFAQSDDPKIYKLKGLDVELAYGDLRDPDAVNRAVAGMSRIAHLGYIMGRPEGMTRETEFQININGTYNVLEAARRQPDLLACVLFASTNATYDAFHAQYVPMDESHPQNPTSFYGMAKLLGERMLEGYGREFHLPGTIVRFGTVPGPDELLGHLRADRVAGYLRSYGTDPTATLYAKNISEPWKPIEEIINGGVNFVVPRDLHGKSWMQDLVDVRDTVDGIVRALLDKKAVGEIFNVTGPGVEWADAVPYLAKKANVEFRDVNIPNLWYWRCDITKAETLLGYKPKHDYRRMIDDALAFEAGVDIGIFRAH
ncbi:MAG: hypothetical protein CMN78_03815 [Spirochaetales bacterium]|nr:hypothetical protein [Spirochaetales bacterium]